MPDLDNDEVEESAGGDEDELEMMLKMEGIDEDDEPNLSKGQKAESGIDAS
jgi:hypothetical protein